MKLPKPTPAALNAELPDSPIASTARALPAGAWVDEFEIGEIIGEGNVAIVYAATDRALAAPVAIAEYMPARLAQRNDEAARPGRFRRIASIPTIPMSTSESLEAVARRPKPSDNGGKYRPYDSRGGERHDRRCRFAFSLTSREREWACGARTSRARLLLLAIAPQAPFSLAKCKGASVRPTFCRTLHGTADEDKFVEAIG